MRVPERRLVAPDPDGNARNSNHGFMDQFLRKYQWALQFAFLGVGATLAAVIVNRTVVSAQLAPLTVPKLPTYRRVQPDQNGAQSSGGPRPERWDEQLASRCYFGCPAKDEKKEKKCPGGCQSDEKCKDGVCVPTEPQTDQQAGGSDVPVESDLNVKLEGCMVADNPQYSTALVRDGSSEKTYVVSPDDYLPENAKVVRIARDRIFIRRNGQLEFIRLEETIHGNPSPVSVSSDSAGGPAGNRPRAARGGSETVRGVQATASASGGSGGGGGGGGDVVRGRDGDDYTLSKKKVQKQLENKRELAREVQTTTNYEDGEKKGVKLVGVSPNSLYSELGLKTGDVLHSVNGEPINSGMDIQSLIERLRGQDSVSVVVERNGEKMKRNYKLE